MAVQQTSRVVEKWPEIPLPTLPTVKRSLSRKYIEVGLVLSMHEHAYGPYGIVSWIKYAGTLQELDSIQFLSRENNAPGVILQRMESEG